MRPNSTEVTEPRRAPLSRVIAVSVLISLCVLASLLLSGAALSVAQAAAPAPEPAAAPEPKAGSSKAGSPKVSPKAGLVADDEPEPKAGDAKAEQPKAEQPKAEQPKAEQPKAGSVAATVADPLPAGEVAGLLRDVRDGGMSVDDPPVLGLVNRLRGEKPEPFLAAEADDSIRWEYLIRWANSSRGRLFTLDGQLASVQTHDLGPNGKVVEVVIREDTDRVFTVLLPEDPGDRNVRIRCRAYFVRVAEDTFRRPTPLLVARTWLKLEAKPTPTMGPATMGTSKPTPAKDEKPPVPPAYATSDGKPLNPDAVLLSRFAEELDTLDASGWDQDAAFDSGSATYTAMEMLSTMSRDAFAIRPEERPIPWDAPVRSPKQYRSSKPVFVQGTVRTIELQPNGKDLGRPGPFWLAVMTSPESRRVHFVVLLKKPSREPKFNARFKGYFIKTCRYSNIKNPDEVELAGVFVAQELDIDEGSAPVSPGSSTTLSDVINLLIRGPVAYVFVPAVALLICVRYVMSRRNKTDNEPLFRQHPNLAPADPLTSKAVIDTLSAMADNSHLPLPEAGPPREADASPTVGNGTGPSHGVSSASRSSDDSRISSLPPDLTKQPVSLSATERLSSDGDPAQTPSDPPKSQN